MNNPRKFCLSKGIYEKRAIEAVEMYANTVADDLRRIMEGFPARPLHERLQDYINIEPLRP